VPTYHSTATPAIHLLSLHDALPILVINVGRSPADRVLVDALASTINQVFEQVFIADISESFNTMIFATNNNTSSWQAFNRNRGRSEEHTSELQSRENLVCGLLLEKK